MAFKNVILVCDSKKANEEEHWKSDIPDFDDEIIRNFVLLGEYNGKKIYHCLIDDQFQLPIIEDKVKNKDKPKKDKLKTSSKRIKEIYKDFLDDPDTSEYAEQIMKYPVQKETDDGMITTMVSIAEAKALGETIDDSKIKIPHQFLGFN